ncbi:hypothetical protein DPEC_G00259780, partial [Dallia pectoralis]
MLIIGILSWLQQQHKKSTHPSQELMRSYQRCHTTPREQRGSHGSGAEPAEGGEGQP